MPELIEIEPDEYELLLPREEFIRNIEQLASIAYSFDQTRKVRPPIAVRDFDLDDYQYYTILDGHHRACAAYLCDIPIRAYLISGPSDMLHLEDMEREDQNLFTGKYEDEGKWDNTNDIITYHFDIAEGQTADNLKRGITSMDDLLRVHDIHDLDQLVDIYTRFRAGELSHSELTRYGFLRGFGF